MSDWFWKKLSYLAGLAAIATFFGLVIFSANLEIKDLDLWLHLATGQHILQHHTIPATDIFSCTIAGQPWINHEWLFQVVVYTIYHLAGAEGLINFQVFIVTITFLILLWMGYNRDKQFGPIFILLLVLLVYQTRFTIRPDLFSLLFIVMFTYVLSLRLNRKSSLWILFILQVLWSNIHGFFIFGPLLVFIGLVSEWTKRHIPLPLEWNKMGRLTDLEYKHLKQILIIVIFASVINPYGVQGAFYPLGVLHSISGESKIFF